MEPVKAFLEDVKLARKQSHANMTVFPLMAPEVGEPDYLTPEEAMKKGLVQVTEVGEEGTVPEPMLLNRGAASVLIIEGEELVGAKQNRIVNASFLIPGKTELKLPVSCVEHGRWAFRSRTFRLVECQVGAVFAINGKVLGMECFGFSDTFRQYFEKLVNSYALDAMDWAGEARKSDEVGPEKARRFLKAISEARGQSRPSLGQGEDLRFESSSVSGAALLKDGKVLHLSATIDQKKQTLL